MANISKAERERRAAEAESVTDETPVKAKPNSHLVEMTKDGETIKVHPSCEADHKRLGWKLV